jgi:23S rRNA (pseudouridine1915-N3)-methyltransferase
MISGDRWMLIWRSAPESSSFTRLVSQPVRVTVVGEVRVRPPFEDDVAHYKRLLARYVKLELVEVRWPKRGPIRETRASLASPNRPAPEARVSRLRSEALARRIPKGAFVSLLAADGRTYDSLAFSVFLEERRQAGSDLAFVIGGPFGAPSLERVDHRLSLGAMTLPHQLAWVVLLEQLYRAHKILACEPYHY